MVGIEVQATAFVARQRTVDDQRGHIDQVAQFRRGNRPDEIARLYQVEIIKLRMQIQEMSKIDRDVISASRSGEVPSDTMARSK